MSYDIKDKVVLITGANRGIGRDIAESFLEHGAAKVYAAVRNVDTAKPLVEKYGDKVVPIYVEMTDTDSIAKAAETASDTEVLVNNAGVLTVCSPLADDTISSLEYEMKVNVYGLINIAQKFAPVLKSNGGGALIQLNSVASLKSFSDFSTYCASKAAAYSITQALREKLENQGTTVVSVHPGPIATEMAESAGFGDIAEPTRLVSDSIINALNTGSFHAFPDTFAKMMENEYQGFAENIVEANLFEG